MLKGCDWLRCNLGAAIKHAAVTTVRTGMFIIMLTDLLARMPYEKNLTQLTSCLRQEVR